jgi:hypothetical protein
MRFDTAVTLFAVGVACACLAPAGASAQGGARFLDGVEVERTAAGEQVRIVFTHPVRYVRHAPHDDADLVEVQLAPVGTSPWSDGHSESLQPSRTTASGLSRVRVEFEAGTARLELRFARRSAFELEPGRDLRSLVLRLPARAARAAPRAGAGPGARAGAGPGAPAAGAATAAAAPLDPRVAELMGEGRKAFTAGDYPRAALLFDQVARGPEGPASPEAREFLGLARERSSQLAHAKAEYEEYLRLYPTGEGADRVRQRLAAMTTAHATPSAPRSVRQERRPPAFEIDTFGSVYAGFRREELFTQGEALLVDNSLLTDVHLDARVRRHGRSLRSQVAASYWHGFLADGSHGEARLYTAFLEAGEPGEGLSGSVGRRSASERGVIGRYDGVQLSHPLGERWEVGAVAGFPLDTPDFDDFEWSRYLAGVNAGVHGLAEGLDANVFAVGQMDAGTPDRAAIGGELRYFSKGRMLAAFVDFDVYFLSLNVAQIFGTWPVHPRLFLTATLDYRNVPVLTTRNALIGQPEGDLGGLEDLFSESEIKELAEDRTARAGSFTLNASYQLTRTLQLAGDFIASHFWGTETSGGVPGFPGMGFEFGYSARLIANDVLAAGDLGVLTLRYFDGSSVDSVGASLDARYPLTPDLRLNPRLWTDFRTADLGGDVVRVVPTLRLDWRLLGFEIQPEAGFEWLEPIGGPSQRQLGYLVSLGVRYDF